ncbi:hypothetical protein PR048_016462 [Dryococelus australis]|uniref:Uncharacterized protein n=1 Tax=Dryococelus australis TaxID=614101 RepID=A0ABQ9HK84_9NEOP|nr:hypothetical protein PR048_016462 [Dryococelus australis]
MTIRIDKLRGQCSDGAANMSGQWNGVQKHLTEEFPKSCFVQCSNHALDLALRKISRKQEGMCDALMIVKDNSNLILESAKRKSFYAHMVLPSCRQESDAVKNVQRLLPLCPTRWAIRVHSLKRFRQNYGCVQQTLEEIVNGNASNERKSALWGYTTFFITAAINIFRPCEVLAKVLQGTDFCAAGANKAVDLLVQIEPVEKRTVTVPRKSENSLNTSPLVSLTPKEKLRKNFYEIVDHFVNEHKRRFDQAGMKKLQNPLSPEELQLESAQICHKNDLISYWLLSSMAQDYILFNCTTFKKSLFLGHQRKKCKPDKASLINFAREIRRRRAIWVMGLAGTVYSVQTVGGVYKQDLLISDAIILPAYETSRGSRRLSSLLFVDLQHRMT